MIIAILVSLVIGGVLGFVAGRIHMLNQIQNDIAGFVHRVHPAAKPPVPTTTSKGS